MISFSRRSYLGFGFILQFNVGFGFWFQILRIIECMLVFECACVSVLLFLSVHAQFDITVGSEFDLRVRVRLEVWCLG